MSGVRILSRTDTKIATTLVNSRVMAFSFVKKVEYYRKNIKKGERFNTSTLSHGIHNNKYIYIMYRKLGFFIRHIVSVYQLLSDFSNVSQNGE